MLMLTDPGWQGFERYNVSAGDYVTVTEIAGLVVERMGLESVVYEYAGGVEGGRAASLWSASWPTGSPPAAGPAEAPVLRG